MRPTPKPGIMEVAPYVPGASKAAGVTKPLKLSANENPLGCSERARAAYAEAAAELHLYPDSRTTRLRAAIAAKHALEPERLVFGAGSDELFSMACQAYLAEGDNIVQPEFGFAAWPIAARAACGEVKSAREREHTVDVEAMLEAIDARTRVVFIANPANPTGTWLPFSEIERLHTGLPDNVLLVLDGAYAECAQSLDRYADGLDWARDKENVLVTRTFSKVHGLASLRIGWGYGPRHVIDALDRIRLPFSVPRAGEAAAVAALSDDAFVSRSVALIETGRRRLAAALADLGVRTLPSGANFVTAYFGARADDVRQQLAARGILVRGLSGYGMPEWLRISIGDEAALTRVIAEIAALV